MNGRRAALLAASVGIALLTSSLGAAADAPDDNLDGFAQSTAVQGTGAPTDPAVPADAGDSPLLATVSGGALSAYKLINQYRIGAGVAPLREDNELTVMAQAWATQMANERDMYTDPTLGISKPLPGWPVDGSFFIELGVAWNVNVSVDPYVAWLANNEPALLYDPDVNQIGVGWSTNGYGEGFLYYIAVQYTFNDIGPADLFYEPVEWLAYNEITTGYPDGGFHPSGQVSREAMAAFLYRWGTGIGTIPACAPGDRMFTDVAASHPFCGAIEWLANQGISTGFPDGTFRPGQPVSREATAAFLYREIVGGPVPPCAAGVRMFVDVAASHPFCGAIEWAAQYPAPDAPITKGWANGTFRPGLSIERQAMAAFLFRASVI